MSPVLVGSIIVGYFILLLSISFLTTRKTTETDFFNAGRQSPWYLVAFGMIGASLSGVTFISIPGEVGNSNFYYFEVVLGYLAGYAVISHVLLPLYYKLNIVSIYGYLEQRFGYWAYKSGAIFFILSRIVGSSFRLFLVASVLQISFFDALDLPFWVAVLTSVLLIWVYTFRGGIKTVVWTDTLQTAFMILSVIISIIFIKNQMGLDISTLSTNIWNDARSTIFDWRWAPTTNFFKQFISGAFIAIVMTGLDQDMMQKNLTCRNLKEAQKNIFWFCIILVIVNFLFLSMGLLLFQYSEAMGITIPERTDHLFPMLAIKYFSPVASIVFLLGITAAAYSSADSALTALTTSFCIDILGLSPEKIGAKKSLRKLVHLGFSLTLFFVILIFQYATDQSVIIAVFKAAGFTYGPLLGMFVVGIYTKWQVKDQWVLPVCISSAVASFLINMYAPTLIGYKFGFEILLVNGALTVLGLFLIKK